MDFTSRKVIAQGTVGSLTLGRACFLQVLSHRKSKRSKVASANEDTSLLLFEIQEGVLCLRYIVVSGAHPACRPSVCA